MADKIKGITLITPEFRTSYLTVFEPRLNKLSNKVEYSVQMIFDLPAKGQPNPLAEIQTAIAELKKRKFPDGKLPPNFNGPLRTDNPNNRPELVGKCYANAKCDDKYKPGVASPHADPKTGKVMVLNDPAAFKSGDFAKAKINAYVWHHPSGKWGVSFGLISIQKRRDGDPLGANHSVENDYEAVAEAPGQVSSAEVDDALAGLNGQ